MTGVRCAAAVMLVIAGAPAVASAQMPNPRAMSGVPLPASDLPAGSVSVRVIQDTVDNNITNHPVELVVDGRKETRNTDESGRVQLDGLATGAKVRAATVINGQRLETQEITIGTTGIRFMLVGAAPAVPGQVALGPESRVIVEFNDDRLNIFYVLHVLNNARVPVDPGGPLILDLPSTARGATILERSSTQASANGQRVVVTSPFAPGVTLVQIGFTLPYGGPSAQLVQHWPANLQELNVLVSQIGGLDVRSPQIRKKQEITDRGARLIIANGPAIPAGEVLALEITGLPHHPRWPRYVALSLAGGISLLGIWAAVAARPRRHAA